MLHIYGQPWTLLGIAVIALFAVLTYRSVIPEKRHLWQWLIPLLIAAAAFGIDALVQTDEEKIQAILDAGIKSLEVKNFNQIEFYISDDYRDSLHSSKEQLFNHAKRALKSNMVQKGKKSARPLITFSQNKAKVNLFMHLILSKDSPITEIYNVPFVQLKVDVIFIRQSDDWLINNIEIRSVNQQPVRWSDVR
jgi:hypothetical protein